MNTDPAVVRAMFAGEYFLFAFLLSLGTLQISVTISGIRGLWLTPNRTVTRWLGIALIITGIIIFFAQPLWVEGPWAEGTVEADSISRDWGTASWNELAGARNVNDIHGGLDGTEQSAWFPIAAILAFAVSVVVGALNVRFLMNGKNAANKTDSENAAIDGFGGMAKRSYFSNLPVSWRAFRAEIVEVWKKGMVSADRWSVFNMIFG
jgi:hypothetical protein